MATEYIRAKYVGGGDPNLRRYEPGTGTLLSAYTPRLNGQEIPGVIWNLALTGLAGENATLTITGNTSKATAILTSLKGTNTFAVVRGTTYEDMVPGADITISPTATNNSSGTVYSGAWLGSYSAGNPSGDVYSEEDGYQDPGVEAGTPGEEVYLGAYLLENVSGELIVEASLKFLPVAIYVPTSGKGLFSVACIADTVSEKFDPGPGKQTLPYEVTFSGLDTGATPDEIDMQIDGELWDVVDTTSGTPQDTSDVHRNSATLYRITEADLDGMKGV